jgi:2-isopropylmalate synthase
MPAQQHRIEVYDTTLRDGSQAEGITYSVEDKIRIARRLDEFGMDFVEGGWPGSNPKDEEFFERMKSVTLKRARLAAFGSTPSRRRTTRNCASCLPRRHPSSRSSVSRGRSTFSMPCGRRRKRTWR